ncbi:hypothetical protein CAPTEDRAFT_198303 [Capitella teleta]|uniref:Uncharacterized protein n=1 Tax=Capitella teleta TaxID=283909 RepID=R7UAV2_CAPTE|nr:hypothetical protein CAPTEDRAFT_198303 [Capitella teleta]|eukprot:ELU03119.1 hypothetical protein CAPTEDRAFT_198303 [Capitella teleta]
MPRIVILSFAKPEGSREICTGLFELYPRVFTIVANISTLTLMPVSPSHQSDQASAYLDTPPSISCEQRKVNEISKVGAKHQEEGYKNNESHPRAAQQGIRAVC